MAEKFELTGQEVERVAELFKVFGDETRMKILLLIYKNSMNVSEIAAGIGMTLSAISHQLKTLKTARLVKSQKLGKEVFYELDDEHVESIVKMAVSHIKH